MTWRKSLVAIGVAALVGGLSWAADEGPVKFHDVRAQTAEFMRYNETIELTREQKAVLKEALLPLAAPCCDDNSAYTCCCECNMKRSWFGLAKHLVADRGLGVEEVRATVVEWFDFIHPNGPPDGRSCYTGRCMKPFKDDGCGGMKPSHVVF